MVPVVDIDRTAAAVDNFAVAYMHLADIAVVDIEAFAAEDQGRCCRAESSNN